MVHYRLGLGNREFQDTVSDPNDHMPLASETPHGGFKQPGFGKDLSHEPLKNYTITKQVMVQHLT